ncbi:MAG: hypothetical protein Q7J85_09600 [Bacillota bacterium]|nr:hypothetical protein [Bacillota bacterium]
MTASSIVALEASAYGELTIPAIFGVDKKYILDLRQTQWKNKLINIGLH